MASFVSGGGGGGSVQQHIFTGTCETAAATPEKTVTLDDSSGFSLAAGVRVAVTFKYGNSATTPTLNVSSSGAKNIVFNSSATAYTSGLGTTNNTWGAYETVIFTYTGSYWTHALSSWGAINTLMKKGTDYVTAGQKSGTTLGTRATTEGYNTTASGNYAHAEGDTTVASGLSSHAEGSGTAASGEFSHAEGYETTAQRKSQHVLGEFNVLDNGGTDGTTRGTYVEIVGNGTNSARSNARTLDWSGNEVLAGKLTVGAAPTNNMDVATKQYVDNAIPTVPAQVSKLYTATCPTAAATAAKVATLDDSTGFSLTVGVRVAVTFTYGNTATTPTLNVSSSGAKTIAIPSSATAFTTGSGTTYNTWGAYETVIFTYTGTYWTHDTSGRLGYLAYSGLGSKANTASPTFTGTPAAPTATAGTNTTQIATTAFVQTELNEVKTSVSNGKSAIASAITDKGVSTSGSDSFATMASNIEAIETSVNITNGKKVLMTSINGNIPANTFIEKKSDPVYSVTHNSTAITTSSNAGSSGTYSVPFSPSTGMFSYYSGSDSNERTFVKYTNGSTMPTAVSTSAQGYNGNQIILPVSSTDAFICTDKYNYSSSYVIRYSSESNLGDVAVLPVNCRCIAIHNLGNNKYLLIAGDNKSPVLSSTARSIYAIVLEVDTSTKAITFLSNIEIPSIGSFTGVFRGYHNCFFDNLVDGSILCVCNRASSLAGIHAAILFNIDSSNNISYKLYNFSDGTGYLFSINNGNFIRVTSDNSCYLYKYSETYSGGYSVFDQVNIDSSFISLITTSTTRAMLKISDYTYAIIDVNNNSSDNTTIYVYDFIYSPSLVNSFTYTYNSDYYNVNYLDHRCWNSFSNNTVTLLSISAPMNSSPTYTFLNIDLKTGAILPSSAIHGVTIDDISQSTAGQVWILDSN